MRPSRLLHDALATSAAAHPDKTVLVCGEKRTSYAELDSRTRGLAAALAERGVRPGDRVPLLLENSEAAVTGFYGVLRAGGVAVPLHPGVKPRKLAAILADCEPAALLAQTGLAPVVHEAQRMATSGGRKAPIIWNAQAGTDTPSGGDDLERLSEQGGAAPELSTAESDLAALIYTSGSTGDPKGIMCPHAAMHSAASSIIRYLGMTHDEVVLDVLPLSFDYGLYQVLMSVMLGATVVLEPMSFSAHQLMQRVAAEGVTGLPLVPTLAAMILRLRDLDRHDHTSLRYLTNTAAALPVEHARQLRQRFPQARLFCMYGLSECKRVSYLPPEEFEARPGSVGVPMDCCRVAVVDEHGRELPHGQVGELVVWGDNVMAGYWRAPEVSARTFRPHSFEHGEGTRLHTGDLFRRDADGYLYFVGRRDDMIKTRGERVSPREIENALCRRPEVAEAFVCGLPDPVLGSRIVAFVRPVTGEEQAQATEAATAATAATAAALQGHCRAELEPYCLPQRIIITPDLPRTANGKVDKAALLARHGLL